MIFWSEFRLRVQHWLHQSWPFRVIAWIRMRGVLREQGFGRFKGETLDDVVTRLRAEIAKLEKEQK